MTTVGAADPYEFLKLLGTSDLESLQRNHLLGELASMIRERPDLRKLLETHRYLEAPGDFVDRVEEFVRRYGHLSCPVTGVVQCTQGTEGLIRIVLEMAAGSNSLRPSQGTDAAALEGAFLGRFQGRDLKHAEELLDLGRASYRLRDDDNIHLARIESRKAALVGVALFLFLMMEATMSGSAPAGSRLAPCPDSPNCVSSLSPPGPHAIEPLAPLQNPDQALQCLKTIVGRMKRARIVVEEGTYLRAEFRTLLGFVDDVEFEVDVSQGLIHMRSASRLGYWDLGVNRRRLEGIRLAFNKTCP